MRWLLPRGPIRIAVHTVLATLLLLGVSLWHFDIPPAEIGGFLLLCVLGVTLLALPAALVGGLLHWVRRRR